MRDTQKSQIISTKLRQIAEQAKRYPGKVFISLCHYMDTAFLEEAYWRLKRDSAPGLSGTTFKDYGKQLEENLQIQRKQRYLISGSRREKRPVGTTHSIF